MTGPIGATPLSGTLIAASIATVVFRIVVATVLAAVTTALSMRLLGIRRGWVTGLVAGLSGWLIGGLVALGLASWDWGADGLVVHTLAVGVPATMAVAVTLDLLRRPGSLAMGDLAGFVSPPRPLRALRRRIAVVHRYRELLRLLQREGFGPGAASLGSAELAGHGAGIRLRRVLEEAGGVYIKIGQIAATRVDLVPAEIADELAGLQNRVAPEPTERILAVIEAEHDAPIADLFADFDPEPLAAASIGQTHRAQLRSGEQVVVKVQRPGIEEVMERDLAALALVARVAQQRTAMGHQLRSAEVLAQFADSLRAELDFRREADAMEEMALLLSDRSPVRIPRVHRALCTRRVLVQERFAGFTLADTEQLDGSMVDRRVLADLLLRTTIDQIMTAGLFHGDPHPGNVFAFTDGSLGLIDFGAVGRLDPIQQSAIVDIFGGLVHRNVHLVRDGIERVADVTDAGSPDELERALARLMAENVRATGAIESTVMQDLMATLSRFGIRLPADVVLLSRALVTLDGTVRVLAPGMSLATAFSDLAAAPHAPMPTPEALLRSELEAALPQLRRLPERIDRILTLTGRGELRLRSIVDEDSRRVLRTLANRALLVTVGAALLLASVALLVARDAGPVVAGGTGIYEVLGYGGAFVGITLLLRVVAAVARDGTT